ncbi:MAG: VOC family protein, partial [Dermatophilaceae bacterium]|nr:VOC family protein [Dermatophilaceae bacterium]
MVETLELRARFARNLSDLYGTEVPAYTTLLAVAEEVNHEVLARLGDAAQRLGSIERVTAERHGAIRVGTPRELSQVARIFGALGMHPTGFYDLRDAAPAPIPVVSTAFRPHDRDQLARNPFRVFVSMLVPEDERFFDEDLSRRLLDFLGSRTLFPHELLALADTAERDGGLEQGAADRFLELATSAFALSPDPVDRGWYAELERVSSVAADIGGVGSTHINHLTPRVLDIDELYRRMGAHGIEMIDQIQGPPRWDGPDILLRQTSFRALAEPRLFREGDGRVVQGDLRVRFGEVEARGVAPTPAGRRLYDRLLVEADDRSRDRADLPREEVLRAVWEEHLPRTDVEMARRDLAYYTFAVRADRPDGA